MRDSKYLWKVIKKENTKSTDAFRSLGSGIPDYKGTSETWGAQVQHSVFCMQYVTAVIFLAEINQKTVWELQRAWIKPFKMEELDEIIMHFIW